MYRHSLLFVLSDTAFVLSPLGASLGTRTASPAHRRRDADECDVASRPANRRPQYRASAPVAVRRATAGRAQPRSSSCATSPPAALPAM
jgi:hypothetical protein